MCVLVSNKNQESESPMKILHVDSSILGENSATRAMTAHAIDKLREQYPDATIERLDLVADPIAHLTGGFPSANEHLRQMQGADLLVVGAPTYNFTVPTQLKAWIDRLAVAGETFRYTETGSEGLAGDTRVIVAIASGGHYDDGHAFEHNKSYLKAIFNFMGIEPEFAEARGLAMGEEARAEGLAKGIAAIEALAVSPALEPA